jgi:transketolase
MFGSQLLHTIPGVDCGSGSLGHGLSFAVGLAISAQLKKQNCLIFSLTGDGECQEGSIWEAALSIVHFNLTNLIWIIDRNGLQSFDVTENVIGLESFADKLEAFGFNVVIIDGHNLNDLTRVLNVDRYKLPQKPLAIIAKTIKGKGIPVLENKKDSHARKLTKQEYRELLDIFGISRDGEE